MTEERRAVEEAEKLIRAHYQRFGGVEHMRWLEQFAADAIIALAPPRPAPAATEDGWRQCMKYVKDRLTVCSGTLVHGPGALQSDVDYAIRWIARLLTAAPAPAATPGVDAIASSLVAEWVKTWDSANGRPWHVHLDDLQARLRAALTDAPLRSCDACGRRGPWPVQQAECADRETGHRGTRTLCDQCAPGAK